MALKNYRAVLWSVSMVLIGLSLFKIDWNPSLEPNEPFLIGQATASGISVAKRLDHVYYTIGICLLSLVGVFFIFSRFLLPRLMNHPFISWIDQLLFLVICSVIFGLFGIQSTETTVLLSSSVIVLLIAGTISSIHSRFSEPETWISFGLVVCVNHALFHSGILASLIALALFVISLFLRRKTKWVQLILSLGIALPMITVFSIETGLILNQRHIGIPSVWFAFIPLFFLFAWFFSRKEKPINQLLYKRFLPLAIVGLILTQVYAPIIDQPEEVFEYANLLNPVMHWYDFGQVPLAHNISSHLLSDYFFEFLYTILNGYDHSAAPIIYHYGIHILCVLVIYYFLKTMWGNRLELVYLFLLLPFLYYIIPPYYAFALFPLIFIKKYLDKPSQKGILAIGLSILFTLVWRLDIGVSLFVPVMIILLVRAFSEPAERRILLRGTISVLLICGTIGLGILALMYGHIREALHYFGANQAHALSKLTRDENFYFLLDYIINPVAAVIIVFYLITQLKTSKTKTNDYILLVLTGFYLFNLQRGLVRHSFMENRDININSFIWLIYLLFSWRFVENRIRLLPFIVAGFGLFTLFTSIHSPAENRSHFENPVSLSLKDVPALNKGIVNRVKENEKFDWEYKAIIQFLRKNISLNETFVDLTNVPMLYYYSHREVPSYFDQYLQNTVDAFLQVENLKELKRHKVPFVILRKDSDDSFGSSDGIPNKIRYYHITSWIYKNYEPFTVVGTFTIWKRKGLERSVPLQDSLVAPIENWDLGAIPYYWKPDKKVEYFQPVADQLKWSAAGKNYQFQLEKGIRAGDFLKVKIQSGTEQGVRFVQKEFSLNFQLKKGTYWYTIPLGCSESLVLSHERKVQLEALQTIKVCGVQKMILKS